MPIVLLLGQIEKQIAQAHSDVRVIHAIIH